MNRLFILTCCICAISASPVQNVKIFGHPRIVNGESIRIEDVPYQVSIILVVKGIDKVHACGGSIISKNLVLTAGHCAELEPKYYAIRSGSTSWLEEDGPLHNVVKIIRHEDFEQDEFSRLNNDIAIMKVEPEFVLDGMTEEIIELADKNDKVQPGDDAYVSGWGMTEEEETARILQGLSLKIMDFDECSQDYKKFGEMTKYNICAQHPSGVKDVCNGDSGGPLVVNGKQVGIVSWSGPGCAIPGRPGVYTDVAHYREWIDEHMSI